MDGKFSRLQPLPEPLERLLEDARSSPPEPALWARAHLWPGVEAALHRPPSVLQVWRAGLLRHFRAAWGIGFGILCGVALAWTLPKGARHAAPPRSVVGPASVTLSPQDLTPKTSPATAVPAKPEPPSHAPRRASLATPLAKPFRELPPQRTPPAPLASTPPFPGPPPVGQRLNAPLREEEAILENARLALKSGRPADAYAAAERHAALFPSGALAEERELLAIKALNDLGQNQQAVQRILAFHQRYPNSVLLPTVDAFVPEPGALP